MQMLAWPQISLLQQDMGSGIDGNTKAAHPANHSEP